MIDKIAGYQQDQEKENKNALSTNQIFIMLGRKDYEIELLMTKFSELKKENDNLRNENQKLYDENIKLGGNISHADKG